MPSRWPAEPCWTSLSPGGTAGSAVLWLRVPARGRASAGRHGISWWLRRLPRYHGSLRAGRDGRGSGRGTITKPPATKPGPATWAVFAHPHTTAPPTLGPRCRPMLKQCCGVCLNEAGRPAALIQDGSSMLGLLPRFLLFLQRMATGDEDPPAGLPSQHATPVNDGPATSLRNFTECSVGVLAGFLAAALPEWARPARVGQICSGSGRPAGGPDGAPTAGDPRDPFAPARGAGVIHAARVRGGPEPDGGREDRPGPRRQDGRGKWHPGHWAAACIVC